MEEKIHQLEKEIAIIKQRNQRVEANKAWETSYFRIATISIMTYIIACILLSMIGIKEFYISALIPVIGFFLSTQSLPRIKEWWIKKYFK